MNKQNKQKKQTHRYSQQADGSRVGGCGGEGRGKGKTWGQKETGWGGKHPTEYIYRCIITNTTSINLIFFNYEVFSLAHVIIHLSLHLLTKHENGQK